MGFDREKFEAAQFQDRTAPVEAPQLQKWFGDAPAVVVVRQLIGHELAKVRDAEEQVSQGRRMLDAVRERGAQAAVVDAMKEAFGLCDEVTGDFAKRLAAIKLGAVDPPIDRAIALKLADCFPVLFYEITNEIFRLTGMGKTLGESNASGTILTSGTA